jgi:hypothetical protein
MDLQARVERLERANRRLKGIGTAVAVLAGASLLMGQNPAQKPAVLEAEKFVVVDNRGKPRAALGVSKGGMAYLEMSNSEGKRLMTLRTIDDKCAALYLEDVNGAPRVELTIADRGPVLNFLGADHSMRMTLGGCDPAALRLYWANGRPQFTIEEGKLRFHDAEGKNVVYEKP